MLNLNDPDGDNFISEFAINMAKKIAGSWVKVRECEQLAERNKAKVIYNDCSRYALLEMPMQSGKTSVMMYILYLLNFKGFAEKLAIPRFSNYVMCHIPDVELTGQTLLRLAPLLG